MSEASTTKLNLRSRNFPERGYPCTPEEAAEEIVSKLLSHLPIEEQNTVRDALEEWGNDWGDLTGSVASEQSAG